LKELCTRDDFSVHRSTRTMKPRNRDDLYLEATETSVNIHINGIDIRAQDLYLTASNDYGSWYYCFEYKVGDSAWARLYEDNDQEGATIGDIEPCKQALGVEINSFVLCRFIIHTLCNIQIDVSILEEHFVDKD